MTAHAKAILIISGDLAKEVDYLQRAGNLTPEAMNDAVCSALARAHAEGKAEGRAEKLEEIIEWLRVTALAETGYGDLGDHTESLAHAIRSLIPAAGREGEG